MERLTEKHFGTNDHYMKCSEFCSNDAEMCGDCPELDKMVNRLAAYENTGYSPADFDNLCREMSDLRQMVGLDTYENLRNAISSEEVKVIRKSRLIEEQQ